MASLPPRPGGSDQRGGAPVQPPLQPSSSVPLQLPIHLALHNPLLPLGSGAGLAGGGGSVGMHAAPRAAYLAFPFVQQPGTAGGPTAATTIQLPHFQLPVAGGGGAALGGLQLGWPMGSGGGAAAAAAAPPPAASLAGWQPGLVLHTQAQMQAASDEHQRRLQQHQAAQSAPAPQIMSNTDVGGSTEGTQAYDAARAGGGGTAGSGRGTLEADESAAAESRLKPGPSSRRGPVGEPRKSRFRGVQWDRSGQKWRARIHTDKTRHIGYFEQERAAGQAWDLAALKYFGELPDILGKLNFREQSLALFRQQQQQQQAAACGGGGSGRAPALPAGGAAQQQLGEGGGSASAGPAEGTPAPQYRGVAMVRWWWW